MLRDTKKAPATTRDLAAADVEISLLPEPSHFLRHLTAIHCAALWVTQHMESFNDLIEGAPMNFDEVLARDACTAGKAFCKSITLCVEHASHYLPEFTNDEYRQRMALLQGQAEYEPVNGLREVITLISKVRESYYMGLAEREGRPYPLPIRHAS